MLTKQKLRTNLIVSQFISLLVAFSLFDIVVYFKIIDSNLKSYILLLLSWSLTFIITFSILKKRNNLDFNGLIKNKLVYGLVITIIIIGILSLFIIAIFARNILGKDGEPISVFILPSFSAFSSVFLVLIVLVFFKFEHSIKTNKYLFTSLFIILSIVIALFSGMLIYQPNSNSLINCMDFDSYWHSAYLYFNNVGVTLTTTSFYGHYGLLLKPIFLLFGFNLNTIFMIVSVERIIIVLVLSYLVYQLSSSLMVRFLGLGLILHLSVLSTGVYPQGWDHRTFFPTLFMLLCFIIVKKVFNKQDARLYIILGYLLNVVSIIWNTDFGIIILIAWTLFITVLLMVNSKRFIRIIFSLFCSILCFFAAWGITSFYNIIVCGESSISLKLFLYPLFESGGIGGFTKTIGLRLQPYILVIVFLLIWLGVSVTNLIFKRDKKYLFTFFISILCLGRMVYFMNRPAWGNLRLASEHELILLLTLTIETLFRDIKSNNEYNWHKATISAVVISQIIIETLLVYSTALCIKPMVTNWKVANSQELYYDPETFKDNFKDNPILMGDGALYVLLNEKLDLESLIVPNFINIYSSETEKTFDILVKEHRPLWIDSASIDRFNTIYSEKLVSQYYESPIIYSSNQMKFYIYYPKQ